MLAQQFPDKAPRLSQAEAISRFRSRNTKESPEAEAERRIEAKLGLVAGMAIPNMDANLGLFLDLNPGLQTEQTLPAGYVDDFLREFQSYRKAPVLYSFGGLFEDRTVTNFATPNGKRGETLHLGLDLNLAKGTPLIAKADLELVCFHPFDGAPLAEPYALFKILTGVQKGNYVFIAGVDEILIEKGEMVLAGKPLLLSGAAPDNGSSRSGLHIQGISKEYYESLPATENNPAHSVERYWNPERLEEARLCFPSMLGLVDFEELERFHIESFPVVFGKKRA
jgi:murein DD-endopeptidase MepM/ murein hydrolase activator NlpD